MYEFWVTASNSAGTSDGSDRAVFTTGKVLDVPQAVIGRAIDGEVTGALSSCL